MGDPFVGFVRKPEGTPTQADIEAAIQSSAKRYGLTPAALGYIWKQEAGAQINAEQVVGYNSAGFGGLFGLPKEQLGTIQEQADAAAKALVGSKITTGTWEGAFRRYSGGGYGAPPGVPIGVADYNKLVEDVRNFILFGIPGSVIDQGPAAQAAAVQAKFPDVPKDILQRALYDAPKGLPDASQIPVLGGIGNVIEGQITGEAPGLGGAAGRLGLTGLDTPFAKNLDELIQAATKPENLWRVGFVLLGAVMIYLGSRLYLTPETAPAVVKGAA